MLLPTMNDAEVYAEIMRDQQLVEAITLPRLYEEYYRERHKFKIDKTREYPKTYRIKTAAKNTWLIILTKDSQYPKYLSAEHYQVDAIVYYFAKEGYRFYRTFPDGKCPAYFYGHFFTRYNERMGLNLSNHPEIVAHFFSHNKSLLKFPNVERGGDYIAALCKHGIALGVQNHSPHWKIYKTFVSHEIKHNGQKRDEQKMQEWLNSGVKVYMSAGPEAAASFKNGIEQIFGPDHIMVKKLSLATSATGIPNVTLPDGSNMGYRCEQVNEMAKKARELKALERLSTR